MSDQKPQGWFVPLRVRFRSTTERTQWERERTGALSSEGTQTPQSQTPLLLLTEPELLRRAQQIKELIRLTTMLHAELSLNELLQQIATSISACTGFRAAAINLIKTGSDHLSAVAFAGMSEEDERVLQESPVPIEQMLGLMDEKFRISQSYFIPHEHVEVLADMARVVAVENYQPGGWHPEDAFIVPLYSPREKKLLGLLSLDNPEDGKIPTLESSEMIELFAHQAALAIDNARIFQEREAERVALEESISGLRQDLERLEQGDLRVRVHSSHEKLQPVVDAINVLVEKVSGILGNVQMVTRAVDDYTREMQRSSAILMRDASQQEQHVQHIARVIDETAATMRQIAERAAKISQVGVEAMEVTMESQSAVDRAVDGMGQVREATLQSARAMKRLGESGQEINDTVLTITDLTTRMNLLALNAAIEAMRAGEHGQGFAIIAQEIRTLAVHSAEAARKVATRIRTIQQETTTVAQSVEQNTRQVVMQTELVTQTGVSLEAISVVTEQMADLIHGISSTADSQVQGSQFVVSAIDGISHTTSEITEHIRQVQQSLASLVEAQHSLHSYVPLFRLTSTET